MIIKKNNRGMYSFPERASAFVSFFSTCLLWYFVIMFTFDFIIREKEPQFDFNLTSVSFSNGREDGFVKRSDALLNMSFDIDADFQKTATWNTKNIFAYISVEYKTERMIKNEFVIWDKILSRDKWTFSGKKIPQKYRKNDIVKNGFGQEKAVVKFCWSITPYVGWIKRRERILQTIQLPIK